jgi:hypothetical protein
MEGLQRERGEGVYWKGMASREGTVYIYVKNYIFITTRVCLVFVFGTLLEFAYVVFFRESQ